MSLDNNDSPWFRDERHREQLAVVVRDDLLGLARYLVNKKRVLLHKEEEEREVRDRRQQGLSRHVKLRNTPLNSIF